MSDLSVREVAKLMNVCKQTAQRWVDDGLLPAVKKPGKFGHEWRVKESDIQKWPRASVRAAWKLDPDTETEEAEVQPENVTATNLPAEVADPDEEKLSLVKFPELPPKTIRTQHTDSDVDFLVCELLRKINALQSELNHADQQNLRLRQALLNDLRVWQEVIRDRKALTLEQARRHIKVLLGVTEGKDTRYETEWGGDLRELYLQQRGEAKKENDDDKVFTLPEAAAFLRLSVRALYRLVQEGKLPGNKVGGSWRFTMGQLRKWMGN